ncbi:MAG: hypothetical protein Q9190_003410 [Brigantiaea leucoxantha]
MSGPRLTFLYPHLFKPGWLTESAVTHRSLHRTHKRTPRATFGVSTRTRQEDFAQRYGPAAEQHFPPPSQPPVSNHLGRDKSLAYTIEKEVKAPSAKEDERKATAGSSKEESKPGKGPNTNVEQESQSGSRNGDKALQSKASAARQNQPLEIHPERTVDRQPLETILQRGSAANEKAEEHKPHLQAPPYVHHFDTFTLVRDLEKGGFMQDQSVTLMKAVRSLLAINMGLAREGLISKSDVENELYLFRAACSELRTEILNSRKTQRQRASSELSHLQHQVEILSQTLAQESSALKEDLGGMLNDRKMAVRMEQQAVDQAIQELNYKITVQLMSGSKSEVEGLRWVLTRRTAIAIAIMAVMILGSLRYSTYKLHVREQEKRRDEEMKQTQSPTSRGGQGGGGGVGGSYTVPAREMGTQTGETEAMLANVSAGDSSAYVSLG